MTRRLSSILALVVIVSATPAAAQTRRTPPPPAKAEPTFGVRVGVSGDPDQFYFGGHVETPPLIEHLTFRPNAEIGVGDDLTLFAFNFEFAYWIPLKNQPWRVYLGGGPALVIRSFHEGHPQHGDSDVGGGLNFLLGIQHRKGLFAELKVGAIDSPTIKFCVGYVFH
jgi:hypothetical protein